MQLYLVRHAESENNAKPIHLRVEDPHLTAVGKLQAGHLAQRMQSLPIDGLITSPVRRALQTTRYIRDATDQHVHVWADVFEEGGIYRGHGPGAVEGGPGLSRQHVIEHLVREESQCTLDDSVTDEGWWGCRNRETPAEATQRATQVIRRLRERFLHDQVVMMVIHADFKRKLLIEMIGAEMIGHSERVGDRGQPEPFGQMRNTGVTKLQHAHDRWQLDWFNCVRHLPPRLITGNE